MTYAPPQGPFGNPAPSDPQGQGQYPDNPYPPGSVGWQTFESQKARMMAIQANNPGGQVTMKGPGQGNGGGFTSLARVPGQAFGWFNSNPANDAANNQIRDTNGLLNYGSPYVQGSKQAGNYNQLIGMLTARANGQGPSIAGDAYSQASANSMNQAASLSNGASAGSARAAMQQMGNINQGLSQGYATARNQEMVGATGQLTGAIGAADTSDLARDKANQDAFLKMLQDNYDLQKAQVQTSKPNSEGLGKLLQMGSVL
jgi:hypothetical protein